jgi:hypothetical protein
MLRQMLGMSSFLRHATERTKPYRLGLWVGILFAHQRYGFEKVAQFLRSKIGLSGENNLRRLFVSGFFLLVILFGLNVVQDYGISWDEPNSRMNGGATVKFIAEKFFPILLTGTVQGYPDLLTYSDRDYGVAFEAPAVVLEQIFQLSDTRDVFMLRHSLTFIVYVAGVFAVYRLATRRFNDWRIGLLAATFFIMSPRLFADAFYNSKDIVFMAAFAIAMNTMIGFVLTPSFKAMIFHGIATAFAIDVRIMAIILPIGTAALILVKLAKQGCAFQRCIVLMLTYIVVTSTLVVAMWPWLWPDPLGNFMLAFRNMSSFRWEGEVLYMGEYIRATNLPWHYPLVWILITTPLLYVALSVIGGVAIVSHVMAQKFRIWANDLTMQDVVFLALFVCPILSVILVRSVLYDGWRHLYFVYPPLILLMTKGFIVFRDAFGRFSAAKPLVYSIVALSLMTTGYWMIINHPLQNLFFNLLAGERLRTKYDFDYWGLANRMAIEYILAHEASPLVTLEAESFTMLQTSLMILSPEQRLRVRVFPNWFQDNRDSEGIAGPLYKLNNYRLVLNNYRLGREVGDNDGKGRTLFYQIKSGDEIVLSVYKAAEE